MSRYLAALLAEPEMAMRWVVKGHKDDNCCDPCKKNIGTAVP